MLLLDYITRHQIFASQAGTALATKLTDQLMFPKQPVTCNKDKSLNATLSSLRERGYCTMQEKMGLDPICHLYLFLVSLCSCFCCCFLFCFFFNCLLGPTYKKHIWIDACISFAHGVKLPEKATWPSLCKDKISRHVVDANMDKIASGYFGSPPCNVLRLPDQLLGWRLFVSTFEYIQNMRMIWMASGYVHNPLLLSSYMFCFFF